MTTEDRRAVPVGRRAQTEPSWGRVLLTTVQLWVSRRWRRLVLVLAAVAVVTLAALQLTGAFSAAGPRTVRPSASAPAPTRAAAPRPVPLAQSEAASWISSQVSSAAVIGCYPALCASLEAQGVNASRLMSLGSAMTGVLTTDVVATLPSADQQLLNQYAPAVIASFGSGATRVEVRAVAPGGAKAYESALRSDLLARKSAGGQLLRNSQIRFGAENAAPVRAGQVDARLLATLAALSTQFPIRVIAFGDSSPGAPVLFRQVTVASVSAKSSAATLAAAQAMVSAQDGPYQAARTTIVHPGPGQSALLIQFAAPGPLGLLTPALTADVHQERGARP